MDTWKPAEFMISHLGLNLPYFQEWHRMLTALQSRTPSLASDWNSGSTPGCQVPTKNVCGFPKVWVASASLDYLPWKKEHPAKVWNNFTVHVHRYLFTPSFIIFSFYLILLQMYWIFKPCSPTSSQQKCFRMRREHCAKFIFHAFPSADLRYNSGIDNKGKTVV